MNNQIKKLLYVCIFLLSIIPSTSVADLGSVRYTSEDENVEIPLDMTVQLFRNTTEDLSFHTDGDTPLCRTLYRKEYNRDEQLTSSTEIETQNILVDFNFKTGSYTCLYINDDEFGADQQKLVSYNLRSYPIFLKVIGGASDDLLTSDELPIDASNLYNLFGGIYKPTNIGLFDGYTQYGSGGTNLKLMQSNYDIFDRAGDLGLFIPTQKQNKNSEENFTVSQFVTALVTLNGDVVQGVDTNGEIIIDSDVKAKMSILVKKEKSTLFSKVAEVVDGSWSWLTSWFKSDATRKAEALQRQAELASKSDTASETFTRYFDTKLFGLYYNFMNIAWGSVFSYGGLLAVGMIFLYSGGIVGYRYGMFRMGDSNKGKDFEFPFSNRLVAISTVFILSFLHYPTGEEKVFNAGTSNEVSMQLQTTFAKTMIGYLANTGAKIADVASNSAVVVYMDYLFKATNTQSYSDIVDNLDSNRAVLVENAMIKSFFAENCVEPYLTNFEKYGSFSGATSHDDAKWKNIGSFSNKDTFFADDGTISPLLCQTLEKKLVLTREYLELSQKTTSKMIDNLQKTNQKSSATTMAQTYVDTQLVGAKTLGWFQASTLPVSHVFMLNSNIINNSFDGLNRSTKGEAVSTTLISKTQDMYTVNEEENLSEVLYDTDPTEGIGNGVEAMLTKMMSYQIYNLLPQFTELRQSLDAMMSGAVSKMSSLVMSVFPQSRVLSLASSAMSKAEDWITKPRGSYDNDADKEAKRETNKKRLSVTSNGIGGLFTHVASFALAILFYKLMMSAIFAGLVTLLAILKICLYFWDVFMHYFVSPLIVAWQMTIQDRTDKVNAWAVDGFVLYVFKPTLIVFSFFMYIISFEILMSIYGLVFDVAFSSINMASAFFEDTSTSMSLIVQSSLQGFADVFIYVIGMIMAYFIILKGDTMILDKFKYKDESDSGMTGQLGEKIQQLAGAKIS
ncbi:hypothetical protein [Poseidonibacter ostreae]|uniref:Type IV secretion system protein n=1 Tax=Poseidonibacter ostreae TaxID=2654171 RepID=A0A6L4WXV0_9BACT|nr:hypothetical protein [Poseidonibacter ostreae]KAB7891280.1 hypothetical protein GBG19_00155 [Poseidonibacter ostreae]